MVVGCNQLIALECRHVVLTIGKADTLVSTTVMCFVLLLILFNLCSHGRWVDGDGVTGSTGNSAVPTEDSLSAGLLAVDDVPLFELMFAIYSFYFRA